MPTPEAPDVQTNKLFENYWARTVDAGSWVHVEWFVEQRQRGRVEIVAQGQADLLSEAHDAVRAWVADYQYGQNEQSTAPPPRHAAPDRAPLENTEPLSDVAATSKHHRRRVVAIAAAAILAIAVAGLAFTHPWSQAADEPTPTNAAQDDDRPGAETGVTGGSTDGTPEGSGATTSTNSGVATTTTGKSGAATSPLATGADGQSDEDAQTSPDALDGEDNAPLPESTNTDALDPGGDDVAAVIGAIYKQFGQDAANYGFGYAVFQATPATSCAQLMQRTGDLGPIQSQVASAVAFSQGCADAAASKPSAHDDIADDLQSAVEEFLIAQ